MSDEPTAEEIAFDKGLSEGAAIRHMQLAADSIRSIAEAARRRIRDLEADAAVRSQLHAADRAEWEAQAGTLGARVRELEAARDALSDTLNRWHREIDAAADRAGVAVADSPNAHQEPLARLRALSERAMRADAAEAQVRELAGLLRNVLAWHNRSDSSTMSLTLTESIRAALARLGTGTEPQKETQ